MQCEQIEQYLPAYVNRSLPTYKLAWVAQHLAGCDRCRALAAAHTPIPRAPASAEHPVSGVPAPSWESAGQTGSYALQRKVPRWVRHAAVLLAVSVAAGAAMALRVAGQRAAARSGSAVDEASTRIRPATAESPVHLPVPSQSQGGIMMTLESASFSDGVVEAKVRFRGRGLTPPQAGDWVRVLNGQGGEVPAKIDMLPSGAEGLDVTARFQLPPGDTHFLVRFGGVPRVIWQRWLLLLPDPQESVSSEDGVLMAGSPSGARLLHYAMEGDLLRIHVRLPAAHDVVATPTFQMRDAEGAIYSAAKFSESQGLGSHDLVLHFPLPREVRVPLTLIGSVPVRSLIGPWLVEGDVLK